MATIFDSLSPDRLIDVVEAADIFKKSIDSQCLELATGPNPSASTNLNIIMDSRVAFICAHAFSSMAVQALYHRLKEDSADGTE